MRKLILCLLLVPTCAFAQGKRDYVPGDGNMDLICEDSHQAATPFNRFDLTLMYDKNSGKDGLSLISDQNLKSGNGDIVYQMKMQQLPSYGVFISPVVQDVAGCEFAPLTMVMDEKTGNFEISFECRGDGDAGYGHLIMDDATGEISGTIAFPEGSAELNSPIAEDTEFQVNCTYKHI